MRLFLIVIFVTNIMLGQMPNNITNVDKIYGLSKFWQEVNYNFVFLDKIDKQQWEENYKKAIIEVQQTKDDYEYY